MSVELKPCPFCGVRGTIKNTKTMPTYSVVCANVDCESAFTHWHKSEQNAVTEWNTRHDGWISVDDKSPPRMVGLSIWCFYDGKQFESECDIDGDWCNVYGDPFTHWMPLPPPPTK